MKTNSKYVFYLDRQKLTIASTQLAIPLILEFPTNIVLDIDIIDSESFELLLSNFLEQSSLAPSDVLLVISPDVYYEKGIALSADATERQHQIDLFLETVPFKNLVFKDYLLGDHPRIITLNKNFYEPLVKFFERNGFNITEITPKFVLEHFNLVLTTFSPKEVKDTYQKIKLIEPYSLITTQDIDKILTVAVHHPKEDNTRTYILLIVFSILFVVLLGYIFIAPRLYKPPVAKVITTQLPQVSPTPVEVEIISSPTPVYLLSENIKIKVVNSSGVANQAAKIKQLLLDNGFVTINTSSSSLITATKNQISFSPLVSPEARQKIRSAIENLVGTSTETEIVAPAEFDVLVTTTNKP